MRAVLDDVLSHSEFTTSIAPSRVLLASFRSLLTPALKTLLKPSVTFRDKRSNGGQKRRVLEACSWSKLPVIQWAAKSCNSFEYMTPIVPGIQMKTVFGCLVSESYCTGLQNKTLTPSLLIFCYRGQSPYECLADDETSRHLSSSATSGRPGSSMMSVESPEIAVSPIHVHVSL